jgi:hypothetical protein
MQNVDEIVINGQRVRYGQVAGLITKSVEEITRNSIARGATPDLEPLFAELLQDVLNHDPQFLRDIAATALADNFRSSLG